MSPHLNDYDVILVNSSAGKDSQAMLTHLVGLADQADRILNWDQPPVRSRMIVVHANLGRAEWPGTLELAREQADFYSIPFEVVAREQQLIEQIEARGMFPSSTARYCTSDNKTSQVAKLMTRLANEWREKHGPDAQIRILNCLGIRAQESPARAKKVPFGLDRPASNGRRWVDRWLPIFEWTEDEVWTLIHASGVPYHPAYDEGMPRLSCVFCVLAGERELVLAARLNPDLAREYVALEKRIDHTFQNKRSMADIVAKAADPSYSTERKSS